MSEEPGAALPPRDQSGRERWRLPLLIAGVTAALLAGFFFYLHGGRYETTDNAYFQSGLAAVSANVSGPVIDIAVRENQNVRTGQILFRIDPAPFETAVAEAEANLAKAKTEVEVLRATYRQGESEMRGAREQLAYAAREAGRQQALLKEGISSQHQYDQAELAARTANQNIQTTNEHNASIAASLAGNIGGPIGEMPTIRRAQALLDRARLDLSYTAVRAAQDGTVTRVNQLQVGNYVAASKPVFMLAGRRIWVEANFKEDQLRNMRVGQRATIRIDAFPDIRMNGRLASFSPGTGNSFALLPAENATGNWVKVVQRLPVEFEIDSAPTEAVLHAGLSVKVTVDTGHQRQLFGGKATAAALAR